MRLNSLATCVPSSGKWYFPGQKLFLWTTLLVSGLGLGKTAQAGLTANDVVVVVNGQSFNSRTLANHYVALRQIPASNVIVLDEVPNSEVIKVSQFREKILRPLLSEIDRRKLSRHVQCVTYSADFPTAIDIAEDLKAIEKLDRIYTKRASINALTFFYSQVLEGIPTYIDLNANYYARRELDAYFRNPSGDVTRASWQAIQSDIDSNKHLQAAESLEQLFDGMPHQFPIAYLSAAEYALGGEAEKAIRMLQKAINAGWIAGGYLKKDERFDAIRDRTEFQVLEFTLDEKIVDQQPSIEFESRASWTPNGIPTGQPKLGIRYLLSTVLGVTRGNGTSLKQAIDSVKRSTTADFTHPEGGFYFSITKDVRSETRKWGFLAAIDQLEEMGFQAEIITSPLPLRRPRVLGIQSGAASFDWSKSGSEFVPGAIADNLTSYGGIMSLGKGQTKMTAFIRAGAAGSSGTVIEPFAIAEKFPSPNLYVHYARGASLAEAFYMSVSGPYQLLIIGDPLCRPFSHAPQVELDTSLRRVEAETSAEFTIEPSGERYADWNELSQPRSRRTPRLAPVLVTAFFDGSGPQTSAIKNNIRINLAGQTAGYHEISLQFKADDPLGQSSQVSVPVWIGDPQSVTLDIENAVERINESDGKRFSIVSLQNGTCTAKITAKNAKRLSLWNQQEKVAEAESQEQHSFEIDLATLGRGPVRLQAVAETDDGTLIRSRPAWLRVDP